MFKSKNIPCYCECDCLSVESSSKNNSILEIKINNIKNKLNDQLILFTHTCV